MICHDMHDVQNKTLFKSSAIGAYFNLVVDDVSFKSKNNILAIANSLYIFLNLQFFFKYFFGKVAGDASSLCRCQAKLGMG